MWPDESLAQMQTSLSPFSRQFSFLFVFVFVLFCFVFSGGGGGGVGGEGVWLAGVVLQTSFF